MRDKEQLYVLLAIICLIGAVMFAIRIINFAERGKMPPPKHPIVAGYMEKVDGNYNLTIVDAYNPGLGLDDVEVLILNNSRHVIFCQSLNYLMFITAVYHAFGKKTPEEVLKEKITVCVENWADRKFEDGMIPIIVIQEPTPRGRLSSTSCLPLGQRRQDCLDY